MDAILNEVEARILGALVEKQVTTPDYYPLTLNALMHACNQTSNRDPVVAYDEKTTARALESLREKNLVYVFYGSDSRVPKYKHVMAEIFHLAVPESALMCILMLRRAAQTVGELRARTNRLYEFADVAEVEAALEKLLTRDDPPLIVKLPRQPGQKEARYTHLLTGVVDVEVILPAPEPSPGRAILEVRAENERIAKLEADVEGLRREVAELGTRFDDFRKQFD